MPSPAPSVYSLTNSLREQSFRREYGREVNNHSEIYRLPADEEEFLRLEKQHRMFTVMMGPWVAPLPDVLASEPGRVKSVLDLGCGTGAWITNVARAFPECSAVGVDLVPVPSMVIPPNCRIEVDDINLGLEHFYDSFDVVQTRLISSGIKDYAGLIDHIARCLRPRGLIVLYECEYRLYNPDKTLCAPWSGTSLTGAPYLCRWFLAFGNAVRRRGGHIDAAPLLHLWVRQHHAFAKEDIAYQEYWYPTPFDSKEWAHIDPFPSEVPEMMRDDLKSLLRSGRPLLLGGGMHPSDVDHLQTNAQWELEQSRIPIMAKMHCVYARKKGRPDK
ncbi:S-adenosyl-L-methionine-dependent methyltransferase [Gautieria morchelliformis]|nr:S-adenosyl-L-methionine-dependent methyltransferase [Gautieria morchelliformis]